MMMLLNKIKTYKGFTAFSKVKMLLLSCSLIFPVTSFSSDFTGVAYNTIHNDQIEIVFSFSEDLEMPPALKTSMSPAFIQVVFDDISYEDLQSDTLVNHAGVKNIDIKTEGKSLVALIHLDELDVFDVAIEGDQFSITLNYGKAAEIVKTLGKDEIGTEVLGSSDAAIVETTIDADGNTVVVVNSNDEENDLDLTELKEQFINKVESIDFRKGEGKEGQLLVYLEDNSVAVDVSDKLGKVYVEFHNTEIMEDLLYKLSVTDFGTVISGIETFRDGRNARLVIDVDSNFTFSHEQNDKLFVLSVKEAVKKAPAYLGGAGDFTGQTISLNFQDIPVRTVLQIIADYNEFNLITSDTVTGNVTLRLDGVPWDQALDIILKVKGLDKRMEGNILMVAPSDELAAREAKNLQAQQTVEELAPLYSEYIQINYAKASNFAGLIKNEDTSILSARGSVSVDERTNTLLIRDTAASIVDIKRMISVLDIAVRQVVIEARMVTVKDNLNEELGIRWGVTDTNGSGTSTSGTSQGAGSANSGTVPALADRMNVNLPAVNPAGSIAFQVARLANGTILDLELSALEKENKGEIIASPRITTANQKEAYIEQGVEIPYQESASSGATATQFKKAVLSLTVTPHITPDDKIILDLVVTQDTVSEVTNGSAPAIDTQRIGTQVLVNNGETVVLGGIYQQAIVSTISKIPVLGDIPYIGWLFRNTVNFNEKKELLIFVTPRIVTEHF